MLHLPAGRVPAATAVHQPPARGIRVVFCDWHGVLSHDRFWQRLAAADTRVAAAVAELFADGNLVRAWMRGERTDQEICGWLAAGCRRDGTDLHEALLADVRRFSADPAVLALLDALPGYVRRVLATDNMRCFAEQWPAMGALHEHFERLVCSASVGALKGQPHRFFGETLAELGVDFVECLLIDDSQFNCRRFRKAGGQALRFRDTAQAAAEIAALTAPVSSARACAA